MKQSFIWWALVSILPWHYNCEGKPFLITHFHLEDLTDFNLIDQSLKVNYIIILRLLQCVVLFCVCRNTSFDNLDVSEKAD